MKSQIWSLSSGIRARAHDYSDFYMHEIKCEGHRHSLALVTVPHLCNALLLCHWTTQRSHCCWSRNWITGDPRSFIFIVIPVVLSSSGGELMMDVNACFTAALLFLCRRLVVIDLCLSCRGITRFRCRCRCWRCRCWRCQLLSVLVIVGVK